MEEAVIRSRAVSIPCKPAPTKVHSFKDWLLMGKKSDEKNIMTRYDRAKSMGNVQHQLDKYDIASITKDALKTDEYIEVRTR
jgi:hypothetical protein